MNALKVLPPIAVFTVFLTGTMVFRRPDMAPASHVSTAGEEKSPASRTRTVRPETVLSEVRALLREGKMEIARGKLRELGSQDAAAFFKVLRKLPGLPGMEEIVKEVAAGLTWNDPATLVFLNGISPDEWRIFAWQGYINARVGLLPDQEVYDTALKADGNAYGNCLIHLLADAAEKRPDAMLSIINEKGDMEINMMFFNEIMKFHPERASELFRKIPDGAPDSSYNKGYVLSTLVEALPTAGNLEKALLERGSRGIYETGSASFLVCGALSAANPQQRAGILEWIGTQPPIARNRLLQGYLFSIVFDYNDPIAPAEFSKILSTYTSGTMQERALERWLKRNQDIDQKDPGWITRLPTERLRNHALVLKGKQMEK